MTSTSEILSSRFAGTFFGAPGEALKLSIPIDPATETTLSRLIAAGLRPLVAGGAVRDTILGKQPKDFDIEVHGAQNFDELRSALKDLGPLNLAGRDFGVLKLRVRGTDGELSDEIDLSLPRRDSKTGIGHRGFTIEVDPQMSLLEATARRDLTVNALMWDPTSELVIDLHGGLKAMEDGVLRHVSAAFSEDILRVLRVARFAAKLGFVPAAETVELCSALKDGFSELPESRIQGELSKLILERFPEQGFAFLQESGWGELLGVPPEIRSELVPALERGLQRGAELKDSSARRVLQLAVLAGLLSTGKARARTLTYFAASRVEVKRAMAIADAPSAVGLSDAEARQWAWDNQSTAREKLILEELLKSTDQASIGGAREQFAELEIIDGPEADRFDSRELVRAHLAANPGLKNGPWIRDVLQAERAKQYAR